MDNTNNTNNAEYSTHNTLLTTLKNSFQNHREYFFLAIPLILILLFIIITIAFYSPKKPSTANNLQSHPTLPPNNSSQNISEQPALPIIATTPLNNATSVNIYPAVSATFKDPLTRTEQTALTLNVSPSVPGSSNWSSDGKTITFIPTQPFSTNQNYTIILSSNKGSYSWGFTTMSVDNVSPTDQAKEQTQADLNYGKHEQSVNNNYPWYNDLPLQTDSYYFYFDLNSKSFIGILYPSNSSNESIDSQVASMKSDIQTQLTNMNIPYTNYPLNWEVTPEP